MFDTIMGLPLHPLVVHAVVVLVPLAAVGLIAIAVRPAWRPTYGPLVVLCALAATAAMPVATQSGEALARRVGEPQEHAELGDQMIWYGIALVLVSAALYWLDRSSAQSRRIGRPAVGPGSMRSERVRGRGAAPAIALMILALVVAAASLLQVYRVGDSGARAVWSSQTSGQSGGGDDR